MKKKNSQHKGVEIKGSFVNWINRVHIKVKYRLNTYSGKCVYHLLNHQIVKKYILSNVIIVSWFSEIDIILIKTKEKRNRNNTTTSYNFIFETSTKFVTRGMQQMEQELFFFFRNSVFNDEIIAVFVIKEAFLQKETSMVSWVAVDKNLEILIKSQHLKWFVL